MNGYKKIEIYREAVKFEQLEDYREAFNLYLASAKQGYAAAQLTVAKFYLGDGVYKGVIKPDTAKAVEYLEQAAAGGNAEAKYRLAVILLEQKEDGAAARALELLQDASDRRYLPATYELAKCYFYGVGCRQNYSKTLGQFLKIVYADGMFCETEYCGGIRKILGKIKALAAENKNLGLNENDMCLFNDLCSDLNVDDWGG